MDKLELQYIWRRIKPIKPWYLLVAFLLTAFVAVVALRNNNLGMVKLRDAVYKADETNGDVQGALKNLQSYVYSHMNTELSTSDGVYPPIQLKYTYQRLQQAEADRINNQSDSTYADAQVHCEQQLPTGFSGRTRVQCIEEYVSSHGSTDTAKKIPDAMYKFNFASPSWSPDVAGFAVAISVILLSLLVLRIAAGLAMKHLVK
ncbi:MAG TPA: hypothetical protein VLA92_00210 [Candidatus Saccharimonadales bacterium]|nr:hypothetical protein [Candidatus Saccharimonadales bacterium]